MNADFRNFKLAASALSVAIMMLSAASAQEFRITQFGRDAAGKPVIRHPSHPDYYYILYRGTDVAQIVSAVDMALGVPVEGELGDPLALPSASFYRVLQVPVAQPLDTDRDGIDDVWELRYRTHGAALNPNDANDVHPGSGMSALAYYNLPTASFAQSGSTNFASNQQTIQVQVRFSKTYAGAAILLLGGTALYGTDFTIGGYRASDQTSRITNSPASTAATFNITLLDAPGIGPDRYLLLSIVQPGTNSPTRYRTGDRDPITHTIRITEGDRGVYAGTLEFTNKFGPESHQVSWESHAVSFALRSGSGNSTLGYLDATQSPLFRRAFTIPVSISPIGLPVTFGPLEYQTNSAALQRTLTNTLRFGAVNTLPSRIEIPVTNELRGLSASGKAITRTGVMRMIRISSPE